MAVTVKDSIKLGRIAGIPVGTNWSVALLAVLMVRYVGFDLLPIYSPDLTFTTRLLLGAVGTLGFLFSILAHELGHALVARGYGLPVDGITLWFLGGAAKLGGVSPSPEAEFRIAAAGPGVNFVLAVVFGGMVYLARALEAPDAVVPLLTLLVIVNLIVLCAGNLIPAAPLDGGRVLTAVLWRRSGDRAQAISVSAWIGIFIGAAFTLFGLWRLFFVDTGGVGVMIDITTLLTGVFILSLARQELAHAAQRRMLREFTTASIMKSSPPALSDWHNVAESLDHISHLPHESFSVLDQAGRPVGIVTRNQLLSVPMWERQPMPLTDLIVSLNEMESAFAEDTLEDVAHRVFDSPNRLIAIGDGSGQVLGTIDLASINEVMNPATA